MANDQLVMELDGTLRSEHERRVEAAIKRLRAFEPPEGYRVAFSGGKDSQCIYHLAKMAGVKFEAHYVVTSVDPPDLIRFVKANYPDVIFEFPRDKDGKVKTMWNLIPKKMTVPTRILRYCCSELKESTGQGRIIVTGVRWAESVSRKMNQALVSVFGNGRKLQPLFKETGAKRKTNANGRVILNDDNDETRRFVEQCYRTNRTLINPIVDWTDKDVWQFLNDNHIQHCNLYDEGWKRIGCIGCPMSKISDREREFNRYPQYRKNYLRAIQKMIEAREAKGKTPFLAEDNTPEGIMRWWIYGNGNDQDVMEAWEVEA